MRIQFSKEDRIWLMLAVGVTAGIAGSALFRKLTTNDQDTWPGREMVKDSRISEKNQLPWRRHLRVEALSGEPCVEDGASLIRQLRLEDWHLRTSSSLDALDFSSISNAQLERMVGELWYVLPKIILSLETAYDRWQTENKVVRMLREILMVYKDALNALKRFEIDTTEWVLSAAAQSYPHCICFLANYGTCAEIVTALAISFPSEQWVCGRLRDELKKNGYHLNRNQCELLGELARPIKNFDEIAIKALNEGFRLQDTSRRKIERSAKVLQESEKLFWESILTTDEGDVPPLPLSQSDLLLTLPTNSALDCLEEQIIAPGEPRVRIPSHLMSDIDLEWNQETRGGESNMPNHGKTTEQKSSGRTSRSESLNDVRPSYQKKHFEPGLHWDNRRNTVCAKRFKSMTQAEQETELNDMKSLYQSLCENYNKMQEAEYSTDEKTSHTASAGNLAIESSESSDGQAQEIGHENRRTFMSTDSEDELSAVI